MGYFVGVIITISILLSTVAIGVESAPILWVGGVTNTSAIFRVVGYTGSTFYLSTASDGSNPVLTKSNLVDTESIIASGLSTKTKYYYGITGKEQGSFTTFPSGRSSFKLAFGSCAGTESVAPTWSELSAHKPDLFIHMGDMHYNDIGVNDSNTFRSSFEVVHNPGPMCTFFRSVPLAYVWDDHDFGPNDANSLSTPKVAARTAYGNYFPHYPFDSSRVGSNVPIYQAFTIGNVRVIIMDERSELIPGTNGSIMSDTQLQWVLSELSSANQYSLVILVSSQVWVEGVGAYGWGLFPAQRKVVSNYISNNNINNIVMLAGDAHMIAIDDGSNSDFSDQGTHGAGFPIFQAAPLDRWGSSKGGPYSQGCYSYTYEYNNQYGVMEIVDDPANASTCFTWSGYRATFAAPLVTYKACTPTVKKGSAGAGKCPIPDVTVGGYVGLGIGVGLYVIFTIIGCIFTFKITNNKKLVSVPIVFLVLLIIFFILFAVQRLNSPYRPGFLPVMCLYIVGAIGGLYAIVWAILIFSARRLKTSL